MAELKTKENTMDVGAFIASVSPPQKQSDCLFILNLMQELTGEPPKMWGKSIVGFGKYHYKYATGREGDWFLVGFSPRKQNISIYVMPGLYNYGHLLEKLGRFKTGVSCIYVKNLEQIDTNVLAQLIGQSLKDIDPMRIR